MAQINKLTPVDNPDPSDLIPFWSQQNGRACCTTFFHLAQAVSTIIINNNLINIGTPITVRDVDDNIVTLVTNLIFDGATVSTNGATVNATATITGAAGIIPEIGSGPVKESEFDTATLPLGQEGLFNAIYPTEVEGEFRNTNVTQTQALSGRDAAFSGSPGESVNGKAGASFGGAEDSAGSWVAEGGDSPTIGGDGFAKGGNGLDGGVGGSGYALGGNGLDGGAGGAGGAQGGSGSGNGGGSALVIGGNDNAGGRGGPVQIQSGVGTAGGGNVIIEARSDTGAAINGNILIIINGIVDIGTLGNLIVTGLPTSDPGIPGAVYYDAETFNLMISAAT